MKLYLSSLEIPTPEDLAGLAQKPLSRMKVAVVPNAKDYYAGRAWAYKMRLAADYLSSLGLDVRIVDLRAYQDAEGLEQALDGIDMVWVEGGNTFCLRYEMRRSGFDKVIRKIVGRGVVYGGESAGAIITGPSIGGIEADDPPEYAPDVITEGLDLIPYVVMPHADNPQFATSADEVRRRTKADKLIEIGDSQAVIFDGNRHWTSERG